MTLTEFSKWLLLKIFKTEEKNVEMSMSLPDRDGRGLLHTRNAKGQDNNCYYFIVEEEGNLFISYMDKEYLVDMLPNLKGFNLMREGAIDQIFNVVPESTQFISN